MNILLKFLIILLDDRRSLVFGHEKNIVPKLDAGGNRLWVGIRNEKCRFQRNATANASSDLGGSSAMTPGNSTTSTPSSSMIVCYSTQQQEQYISYESSNDNMKYG